MTALVKFLKALILGGLALALAGAVIGAGYWQYTRQAELFDGFEYMAWDSNYQRQIATVEDGEGREFKVMKLARRYDDHWIVGYAFPDGYVGKTSGDDLTNHFRFEIFWDADCSEGSEIDTGREYANGSPITLDCVDGDKLNMGGSRLPEEASSPWDSIPDFELDFGGFKADLSGMKYWPWDEAQKFATLQKATMISDSY